MWPRTALVLWLLVASLTGYTCGPSEEGNEDSDENFMSVSDEDTSHLQDEQQEIFAPTKDWKVVKDGQHIPPGLHVRMDFQTGIKEAKLLDKEEERMPEQEVQNSSEQPSTNGRAHYYGESDRRGVVNKRTKVFSAEEVENMLKDMNNETFDPSNLPQLASTPASSKSGSTTAQTARTEKEGGQRETRPIASALHSKKIPVTRHQDVEEMLELLGILANGTSSVADLCQALEELEYYVHQIHNAHDLNAIGGLVLVVRLLNHTHGDVKSWAARVIGSASQSNPPVQELALQYGSLALLCHLLLLSETEIVQRRALFALSALLRGNTKEQLSFIKNYQGLSILGKSFSERSLQVQVKAVVLLTDILDDELIGSDSSDSEHHLELPILVYNEVLSAGWCNNVPVLIHSDQLMVIEKGLLAMRALSGTCSFTGELSRLKELVRQWESGAGAEVDTEYTNQLLEHCRALLKYIRNQNLDL